MRPKKTILLVDGDERRAALRKFILETRGYAVHIRTSLVHAANALHPAIHVYGVDLVMISDTVAVPNAIVRLVKDINPETRAILLEDSAKAVEGTIADAMTTWDMGHAADILSMVRILVARKRGPKKPLQQQSKVRSAA